MTRRTVLTLHAAIVIAALVPCAAQAAEHVVSQKNKAFTTKQLKAKVGDKVVFRNDDTFAHNIFSLSEQQSFDLGTFGQGASKEVVLAKDGKLEIECAIHPEMKLVVEVAK
jgi:plastocyanin